MAALKPFQVAPRGFRWPWYPYVTVKVTMTTGRRVDLNYGPHAECELKVVSSPQVGKVGLRRWARHLLTPEVSP